MAVTENKYQLGTAENQKFLQDVRDGLLSWTSVSVTRRKLLLS